MEGAQYPSWSEVPTYLLLSLLLEVCLLQFIRSLQLDYVGNVSVLALAHILGFFAIEKFYGLKSDLISLLGFGISVILLFKYSISSPKVEFAPRHSSTSTN